MRIDKCAPCSTAQGIRGVNARGHFQCLDVDEEQRRISVIGIVRFVERRHGRHTQTDKFARHCFVNGGQHFASRKRDTLLRDGLSGNIKEEQDRFVRVFPREQRIGTCPCDAGNELPALDSRKAGNSQEPERSSQRA